MIFTASASVGVHVTRLLHTQEPFLPRHMYASPCVDSLSRPFETLEWPLASAQQSTPRCLSHTALRSVRITCLSGKIGRP